MPDLVAEGTDPRAGASHTSTVGPCLDVPTRECEDQLALRLVSCREQLGRRTFVGVPAEQLAPRTQDALSSDPALFLLGLGGALLLGALAGGLITLALDR